MIWITFDAKAVNLVTNTGLLLIFGVRFFKSGFMLDRSQKCILYHSSIHLMDMLSDGSVYC